MNEPPQISNLTEVIGPYLHPQKLISYSSRYLTKPGENYGSIMLGIDAKVQNPNGTIENLSLVAKLPPLTSEELWKLFRPESSFLRETTIYLHLSPSIRQLQLDSGVPETELDDLFAKFYGCRISLDEKTKIVDRDAVLVLEDLKCLGYKPGIRQNMFDLDHIRLVLKYAAKYHAYPIAVRNKQPKKFKENIVTTVTSYGFFEETESEIREICKEVKLALGDDEDALNRYKEMDRLFHERIARMATEEENLFNSIAHFDLWINNVMIHYDESGSPDKLKIIDFQSSQYTSLAHDLHLLLFTSVKTDILENHFHELLHFYYEEFINCLKKVNCNFEEYSYNKFFEEMKRVAPVVIPHAIFMSKVIMTDNKHLTDEVDINALHSPSSPEQLEKIREILRLANKFGFFD